MLARLTFCWIQFFSIFYFAYFFPKMFMSIVCTELPQNVPWTIQPNVALTWPTYTASCKIQFHTLQWNIIIRFFLSNYLGSHTFKTGGFFTFSVNKDNRWDATSLWRWLQHVKISFASLGYSFHWGKLWRISHVEQRTRDCGSTCFHYSRLKNWF